MTSRISKKRAPQPQARAAILTALAATDSEGAVQRSIPQSSGELSSGGNKQGKEAVVILAIEEFERLTKRARQPEEPIQILRRVPLAKVSIDLERKPDYGRAVDL